MNEHDPYLSYNKPGGDVWWLPECLDNCVVKLMDQDERTGGWMDGEPENRQRPRIRMSAITEPRGEKSAHAVSPAPFCVHDVSPAPSARML